METIYDDRFHFPKLELPSWSCLEGGKGARRGDNGKFYLPPGSNATARMGVMGDDKDPNKPALEPTGVKAKGGKNDGKTKFNPDGKNATEANLSFSDIKAFPPGVKNEITRNAVTKAGTPVLASIGNGEVLFTTNDQAGTSTNKVVDPIAAGKLALSEAREIVRSLPDGTLLKAVPVRDATGKARVRTYQKLGFGEMLGGTQWAVKKGGKLIPVDAEFFEAHLRPNANKLKGYSISSVPLVGSAAERRRMERMPRTQETDLSDLADLFG